MAGLTAPRESKILGPDGKPFVTQVPVRFDPEAPREFVYHLKSVWYPPPPETLIGRVAVIHDIKMPED